MFTKFGLMAAMIFLAACHSNPYAETQGNLAPTPPEHKTGPVITNFYVEVDAERDVAEAASTQIKVKAVVPSGSPIIRYDGLPSFCSPDSTGAVLTCSPNYGDAYDPKTPNDNTRSYEISIYLSYTDAPSASIPPTTVTLIVHHVARGISINNFPTNLNIDENQDYQSNFQVVSAEFPNGPFTIASSGLPVGLKIASAGDPTHFIITYKAPYTTVKTTNKSGYCGSRMCLNIPWDLTVLNPRGEAVTQQASWSVVDVRQNPVIVSPSTVIASFPNADFYVTVEDPNGEVAPQVTNVTSVGTVSLTVAASSPGTAVNNPYAMMHAAWTGNPPSSKGTAQTFNFKSCVYSDVGVMNQCVTSPVNVQF